MGRLVLLLYGNFPKSGSGNSPPPVTERLLNEKRGADLNEWTKAQYKLFSVSPPTSTGEYWRRRGGGGNLFQMGGGVGFF